MLIVKCKDGTIYRFSKGELIRWDLGIEGLLLVRTKGDVDTFFPLCNVICFSYEEVKNAD